MVRPTEQRSTDRKTVSWRVRAQLPSGKVVEGKTTDASANGLGILVPVPVAENVVIQLAVQVPIFNSPGKFQVAAGKARVVFQVLRGNEYQLGIEWIELDDAMRQLIVLRHTAWQSGYRTT